MHWSQLITGQRWTPKIVFSPVIRDVFASGDDDGAVRIWQVSDRRPLRTLEGHKGRVSELAFSPNGRLLISGGSRYKRRNNLDELRLWDVSSGNLVFADDFYNDSIEGLGFLDDETIVFARNDEKDDTDSVIEFRDVASWSLIRSIRFTPGGAQSLLISEDRSQMIITGGQCVRLGPDSCLPTGYFWFAT